MSVMGHTQPATPRPHHAKRARADNDILTDGKAGSRDVFMHRSASRGSRSTPPPSSALDEEERLVSLLLSTAARDPVREQEGSIQLRVQPDLAQA
jgi:hypothetical protein